MPTFKPRSATEEDLVQRARTVLPGGMLANLYKPEEYLFVPERGDGGRVIDKIRQCLGRLPHGERLPAPRP